MVIVFEARLDPRLTVATEGGLHNDPDPDPDTGVMEE